MAVVLMVFSMKSVLYHLVQQQLIFEPVFFKAGIFLDYCAAECYGAGAGLDGVYKILRFFCDFLLLCVRHNITTKITQNR